MTESDLELPTTILSINRRIMTVIKVMRGIIKRQLYQFPYSETRLTFLKQHKKREEENIFQFMQLKSSILCKNEAGNFLRTVLIKTERKFPELAISSQLKIPNENPFWLGCTYTDTHKKRIHAFPTSGQVWTELQAEVLIWLLLRFSEQQNLSSFPQ